MGQLSPDGHWQWDGWRWVPAATVMPRPKLPRRPTVWTRRLQILLLALAGWGLLSGFISAALVPGEWAGTRAEILAEWHAQGIPAGEIQALQSLLSAVPAVIIVVTIVWTLGFCALRVAGTLRRWVWWYWVQFALCCLSVLDLLYTLVNLVLLLAGAGGGAGSTQALATPLTLVGDLLNIGVGVCMLIAVIRIGPWAMTRTQGP